LALPAWLAVTVQAPVPAMVIVLPVVPEARQTLAGVAAKVTGLPEPPPVALTVRGDTPYVRFGNGLKPIVCGCNVIVSVPAA
jgi:hypothetical protein